MGFSSYGTELLNKEHLLKSVAFSPLLKCSKTLSNPMTSQLSRRGGEPWGEGQEAGVEVQILMESFNTFSPISFPSHCTWLLAQYVVVTVCLKAGLETLSWNKVSIC